jgi:hypothetical protein
LYVQNPAVLRKFSRFETTYQTLTSERAEQTEVLERRTKLKIKAGRDLNRRKFLRRVGTGTVALGSLPLLAGRAWAQEDGEDKGFHFLCVSLASAPATDRVLLLGDGTFDEAGNVEGGGKFDHWKMMGSAPLPIVSTGTWRARKFVSFALAGNTAPGDPEGTHGPYQAGVLTLNADFYPIGQEKMKDVELEVVCNLGPAGASTTGLDEGVYLTLDGVALHPNGIGITAFTL